MQIELLGEGQLEVMAGDRLVERGRGEREACPPARIGGVEIEHAVAAPVGRRGAVVRHPAGLDGDDVALGAGETAEPTRRLKPAPIEHRVDVLDDLIRRLVLHARVGAQPVTHQRRVIEAEHRAPDVPALVIEAGQLGEAKLVNRVGSV